MKSIAEAFADPPLVRSVIENDVPLLAADWGAKDEGALIHSLGLHLLASLGRAVGYVGLPEFPVPRARQWQKKAVRVDCAWIDRQSRRPVLLAEFERYSMATVLEKQTNLYVAAHGCDPVPEVLVLCIWALDGVPVDLSWFDAQRPLAVPGGPPAIRPKRSDIWLIQAVFGRRGEHLHFLQFRR